MSKTMVLNLAIWFGLRVMFTELVEVPLMVGEMTMMLPSPASFDPLASAIMGGALLAITRFRVGMIKVLLTSAATGLAFGSLGLV